LSDPPMYCEKSNSLDDIIELLKVKSVH
jgi:hypothetical protein